MNEHELKINAIKETIEFLKRTEPKCICEQCKYSYRFDKKSNRLCLIQKQKKEQEHIIWEQKLIKWETRLKNEQ